MRVKASIAGLLLCACGNGGSSTAGSDAGVADATGPGTDGALPGDAQPAGDAPAGDAPMKGVCGSSEWPTYGHDPERTSASDGCIRGPLTTAWTYTPTPKVFGLTKVHNLVTANATVYARFQEGYGPGLAAASTAGNQMWAWTTPPYDCPGPCTGGRDDPEGFWATVGLGAVLVEDDGLCMVDAKTGADRSCTRTNYDVWGQNTADDARFYVNSELYSPDGAGIYVGAHDPFAKAIWQADQVNNCGTTVSETYASIALDAGVLFRSAVFQNSNTLASGIASFDAASGAPGWKAATTPASAISAGGGMLFLVESANGATALTARKQADGSVTWTAPVDTPAVQAPVVAAGLVIVATQNDVRAFRASSGQLAWTAANVAARVVAQPADKSFNNCPQSTLHVAYMLGTTLAAAVGSNSLVVTASDAIYVLSLDDGSVLWHGTPSSVTGPTRNPVIVGHTLYVVDGGAGTTGRFAALTSP